MYASCDVQEREEGRMVHSRSINDSSTSFLCFLKMKGPLNKEVYGNPPCLRAASTSLLLYIYNPADWRLRRRPVFVCKVLENNGCLWIGTDGKCTVSSLEKTVPSLYCSSRGHGGKDLAQRYSNRGVNWFTVRHSDGTRETPGGAESRVLSHSLSPPQPHPHLASGSVLKLGDE